MSDETTGGCVDCQKELRRQQIIGVAVGAGLGAVVCFYTLRILKK